jgi:mevalonate pyrophosphate decarboxylase
MALVYAAGMNGTSPKVIASIAIIGNSSAAHSIMGGFSMFSSDGTIECLATAEQIQMPMIFVPIDEYKYVDESQVDIETSPFFKKRMNYLPKKIDEMKEAINEKALHRIGFLAEYESIDLHTLSMTGKAGRIHWHPDVVKAYRKIKEFRESGCYGFGYSTFISVDNENSLYVNVHPYGKELVSKMMSEELGLQNMICEVGGPARIVEAQHTLLDHIR